MMPDGREMRVPKPEIFLGKLRKTGPERSFEAFEIAAQLVGDVVVDQISSNKQLRFSFRYKVIEPLQKMVGEAHASDPVIIDWL